MVAALRSCVVRGLKKRVTKAAGPPKPASVVIRLWLTLGAALNKARAGGRETERSRRRRKEREGHLPPQPEQPVAHFGQKQQRAHKRLIVRKGRRQGLGLDRGYDCSPLFTVRPHRPLLRVCERARVSVQGCLYDHRHPHHHHDFDFERSRSSFLFIFIIRIVFAAGEGGVPILH